MRLKKLIRILRSKGSLPYLVTDLVNVRYLTGFTGTYASLVVGRGRSYFISDSRYEEYARSIMPKGVDFVLQKVDFLETLKSVLKTMGTRELYLEEHSTPFSVYRNMKRNLKGVRLQPGGDEVNSVRMIKDEEEIAILRQAAKITDGCVEHLKKIIRPGDGEWDIAVEIEHFYRRHGCRKSSFDCIIASGPGSSMPHYATSMDKKVRAGEVILIDMGCEYHGYNSDLTRTMFVSSIDPALERIYRVVLEAQEAAVKAVRPGITTGKLDAVARDIITEAGYGERFGHSLGHGIGMEVHELPAIKTGDLKLKKNMAITIEPGIYVPGVGGVRIEDMVMVTARGHEVLTKSSKDIIVIG
ncbi:MAG TPA: Xaa-Pro peptidase family protein [Spirochaetota bacterium]|jgi:Xaa-Pro aminopeptidase|nr:Xaa-Pro peptidase family protein [Spirochaetota bacterium]HPV42741.1 Xaa-Pro peptidase family protein [Spirochaetota bacterium]